MSLHKRESGQRRRWLFPIGSIAIVILAGSSSVWAANVSVGSITVTNPKVYAPATGRGGEVVYAYDQVNLTGTCLAGATVHWIQLVTVSTAMGPNGLGLAGFSNNTSFIDPIQGQSLGLGQVGNNTPYYDITVNGNTANFASVTNFADFSTSPPTPKNWQTQGTGNLYTDAAWVSYGLLTKTNTPWTFTAQTLLVATTAAAPNTLNVLGGFQWGFTDTIDPNNCVAQNPTALTWANINANTWQTALNADFGPAGTYTFQQATCAQGNPVIGLNVAPEPSTMVIMVTAIPCMIVMVLRRRRTAA